MITRAPRMLLSTALLVMTGCAVDDPADTLDGRPGRSDATFDVMPGAMDAMPDAMDAMPDAMDAMDAMPDAMPQAPVDAAPDESTDARPADAAVDLGPTRDGGPDVAVDAAPDPDREHRCDDGIDDDDDGAVDCADGDCLAAAPCAVVPETPVQFVQELFLQRCGCHTGALDFGGLRLVRPFTDFTVNRPAVIDPERLLIAPGAAQESFLYLKLLEDLPPSAGERMPPEIPYLDAEQLALIADWIDGLGP